MISAIILCLTLCIMGINTQSPEVTIPQGQLSGKIMTDMNGDNIYAFQGIPYGKPPINELRFKPPEPADGWDGVKDATSDAISCIQHSLPLSGQEDCLYLNVYTPELPTESSTLLPVMVWVHGGGFDSGSFSTNLYGPEFLLTENVVLVTLNYRLSIFGGFSVDDAALSVTGNLALKDQLLAFKWVKENIVNFGGDPENITIFGESAGAISVHMHLLSPKSTGYFHKAIAQSGVAVIDFINTKARNNGIELARQLGIQTENLPDMLSSLQELPVTTVLTAAVILASQTMYFHYPTIEIESEESFLSQHPLELIETGQYNQVPFLFGVNDAEGLLFQFTARLMAGQNITIDDFSRVIPQEFQIDPNSDAAEYLSEKLRQFYYGDEQPSQANIAPTVHLLGDFSFIFPAYRAALGHAKTSLNPIYFYLFTADTRLNLMKHLDETTTNFPGASHADELSYMFNNIAVPPGVVEGTVEYNGLRRMVKLWTNFAKFDQPTPDSSEEVIWEPVAVDQFKYLEFGSEESIMRDGIPLEERVQFWADIYEEFLPGNK